MATIGYGKMVPRTTVANALVTTEALIGMLGVSLGTGLMFAKFSRPRARVLWSRVAVVGPRDGTPCLMFRIANERQNQIVEASARVVLLRSERTLEGELVRRMVDLELARASTSVFALTWTVIHPITPKSPLYGKTRAWLEEGSTEVICSVMGHDDTFSQTVHARHSYQPSEVVFGARLADVFSVNEAGKRVIDYRRFHEVELLPAASETAERASA